MTPQPPRPFFAPPDLGRGAPSFPAAPPDDRKLDVLGVFCGLFALTWGLAVLFPDYWSLGSLALSEPLQYLRDIPDRLIGVTAVVAGLSALLAVPFVLPFRLRIAVRVTLLMFWTFCLFYFGLTPRPSPVLVANLCGFWTMAVISLMRAYGVRLYLDGWRLRWTGSRRRS
jgi:hypothetical protein